MSSADSNCTGDMMDRMLASSILCPASQLFPKLDSCDLQPSDLPEHRSELITSLSSGVWGVQQERFLNGYELSPLWSPHTINETNSVEQQLTAISKKLDALQLTTNHRFDLLESRSKSQNSSKATEEIEKLNFIIEELQAQDCRKENEFLKAELQDVKKKLEEQHKARKNVEAKLQESQSSEAQAKEHLQISLASYNELQRSAESEIRSLQDVQSKIQNSFKLEIEKFKQLLESESETKNILGDQLKNLKKTIDEVSEAKIASEVTVKHLKDNLEKMSKANRSLESDAQDLRNTLKREQKVHKNLMEEKDKVAQDMISSLEKKLAESASTAADSQNLLSQVSKLQTTVTNQSKQYQEQQKKWKQDRLLIGKLEKKCSKKDEEINELKLETQTLLAQSNESMRREIETSEKHMECLKNCEVLQTRLFELQTRMLELLEKDDE